MRKMFRFTTGDDEAGVALVVVVGTMMTLMVLALGGLAYALQSQKFARFDQDYSAAISAAQSGVDEYISRLNRNDDYARTVDCANPALKGPMITADCPAWNLSTPVGWLPVTPGDTAPGALAFHYRVDPAAIYTEGTVLVVSTGRSRNVFRTIEVAVGKGGSTDYVYYTDFESADPANKVSYPTGAPDDICGKSGSKKAKYFYNGRKTYNDAHASSKCSEITFISTDSLDGRVFSNDAILSANAKFLQGIESGNTGTTSTDGCQRVTSVTTTWNRCLRAGSAGATFGVKPVLQPSKILDDNSAGFAAFPGCHYYGATRVIFKAGGTMTVWSKSSTEAVAAGLPLAIAEPAGALPACGTPSALRSTGGATVPVPNNQAIYVAAAPTTVENRQLYADEIDGVSGGTEAGRLPLGTFSGAPATKDLTATYDLNLADATKYRAEGNLYVQGTVEGRVTVAAVQSVIVTGDLVLAGGYNSSDMLGLVATNSVEVMHPRMVTTTSYKSGSVFLWHSSTEAVVTNTAAEADTKVNIGGVWYDYTAENTWPVRISSPEHGGVYPASGIQIAGSLQTLLHSFFVQQYNAGPAKGELFVKGSIAQRWRGAVGTGSGGSMTGYSKKYSYDQRLKFSAPPYFPRWADAEWLSRYSGEVKTPSVIKG